MFGLVVGAQLDSPERLCVEGDDDGGQAHQDGSIFDQDGSADGSVQLDGAIGYVPMSLISYTPDAPVPHVNAPVWD